MNLSEERFNELMDKLPAEEQVKVYKELLAEKKKANVAGKVAKEVKSAHSTAKERFGTFKNKLPKIKVSIDKG